MTNIPFGLDGYHSCMFMGMIVVARSLTHLAIGCQNQARGGEAGLSEPPEFARGGEGVGKGGV
jgi:hypothetical protein